MRDRDPAALFFNVQLGKKCIGDSRCAGKPDEIYVSSSEHPKDFKKWLDNGLSEFSKNK
jgi:hypothetical protein